MNILFSCDEYPPAKTGGIGTVTKIVAEALASRGHSVYVVSSRPPYHDLPEKTVVNGVTIYRLTYLKSYSLLFHNNVFSKLLLNVMMRFGWLSGPCIKDMEHIHAFIEKLIHEEGIDVVEYPDYCGLAQYYSKYARFTLWHFSVPMVARVHGSVSFLSYYKKGRMDRISALNDRDFFEQADHVLAVSRFSSAFLSEHLGVTKSVDVIYNPLENLFLEERKNPPTDDRKTILFVGKVIETKGAFNLIRAFNIFSMAWPEYRLVMVGGGELDYARKILRNECLGKVDFTGYLSRKDIIRSIREASFCVIPSFYENFSMTALEVMGLGKALIYTYAASGPEVIDDGIDGLLVDPHNIDEIAEKMMLLASDKALRDRIGKNAAEKILNNFSEDVIIRNLEDYYYSVIR